MLDFLRKKENILIVTLDLKRFSETRWSKLTNVIEFPTGERELNLQQYASEDHQGPVNYSLYGISNHMGKCFLKWARIGVK